jgi:hypothetical protein
MLVSTVVQVSALQVSSFQLVGVNFKGIKQVDGKALSKILSTRMPNRLKFWKSKPD